MPVPISPLGPTVSLFEVVALGAPLSWQPVSGASYYIVEHTAHDLINGEGVVIPGTVREFSTSQTELVLPLGIREPGHCADVDNCTLIYSWRVWPANGCGLGPVSEGNYYGTF